MKNFIFALLVLSVLSCTNSSDQSNSETNNYNSSNNPNSDERYSSEQLNNETNVGDDAMTFMKLVESTNVFEIELGKLAQEKASNMRVKNFGRKMASDHTKIHEDLKSLAVDKNIIITYSLKPDQKKEIEALKKLEGQAFDKRYMEIMMAEHMNGVEIFTHGADTRDKDVNDFASGALPVLKMHLDSARAIQASLN